MLMDFAARLLGRNPFEMDGSGNPVAAPDANAASVAAPALGQYEQDLEYARWNKIGDLGMLLMAAGQRMTPSQRAALLAQAPGMMGGAEREAMNAAQARLYGMHQRQAQEEADRVAKMRERMPELAAQLKVNPADAELLGLEGLQKLRANQLSQDPVAAERERVQLEIAKKQLAAPDKQILSPYEEATQKSNAEFEGRSRAADQLGLQGDERKEYIATGKLTTGSGAAPTQDQANAATFYTMMNTAEKQLSDEKIGPAGADRIQRGLDALPYGLGHGLTSPEYQLAEHAQRNFIAAYLRKTSGQNITDSEFAMHRPLFFPQPGESDPRVLAQKAQARADAMSGILGSAPLKFQKDVQQRQEAEAGAPPPANGGAKILRRVR